MSDRYVILPAASEDELEMAVNEYIEKGWRPTGGVFVVQRRWTNERKGYEETEERWLQALVR